MYFTENCELEVTAASNEVENNTDSMFFSQNDYNNYTLGTSWLMILLLAGDTPLSAGVIVAVSISAIMFVLLMNIVIIVAIMCIMKGGKHCTKIETS